MENNESSSKQWAIYLGVPFVVHLVLRGLTATEPFTGGPLEHFYVRFGIALVVTALVAAAVSLRRSARR